MTDLTAPKPDDLVERLRRLIERQRDQRGDYLYRGDADSELIDCLERIEADADRLTALEQERDRLREACRAGLKAVAAYEAALEEALNPQGGHNAG